MSRLVNLLRTAFPAIAAAATLACGGGPPAATSSPGSAPSSAPTAGAQVATAGPVKTFSIALIPENGGTVQATLNLTVEGTGYTIHLEGHSLHPGRRYLVNTHAGSCAAEDVFAGTQPVGYLVADATGNGSIDRSYGRAYVGGGIITVHGYDGSGGEFTHIACAELPTG